MGLIGPVFAWLIGAGPACYAGVMARSEFTEEVLFAVRAIPEGRVATYGQIAALAGNPRAARQVARVLHTFGASESLPWHRVVNREGRIVLTPAGGGGEQARRLTAEGVARDSDNRVDLDRYLWRPDEGDFASSP